MGGCLAVCGGCRIACSEILNLKFGIVQRRIEHPALRLPASGSWRLDRYSFLGGGANTRVAVSAVSRCERRLRVFIAADPMRSQKPRIKNKTSNSSLAPRPDPSLRDRRDKNRLCASPGQGELLSDNSRVEPYCDQPTAGGADARFVVSAFSRSERHLLAFISVDWTAFTKA